MIGINSTAMFEFATLSLQIKVSLIKKAPSHSTDQRLFKT